MVDIDQQLGRVADPRDHAVRVLAACQSEEGHGIQFEEERTGDLEEVGEQFVGGPLDDERSNTFCKLSPRHHSLIILCESCAIKSFKRFPIFFPRYAPGYPKPIRKNLPLFLEDAEKTKGLTGNQQTKRFEK